MMDSGNNHLESIFEHNSLSIDKMVGAILGAAIGDALGWPQEKPRLRSQIYSKGNLSNVSTGFKTWQRRSGGRFFAYEETINAGEYSDDTQLILATIRSMKKGINWNRAFCLEELPIWLLYERGGGQSTKSAAQSWLNGIPPWRETTNNSDAVKRYFGAGGNGVAMRILPHALLLNNTELSMYRQIMLNGISTHGHPVALVGALLYGKSVNIAFHNKGTLKLGALIDELMATKNDWSAMPKLDSGFEEWSSAANKFSSGYAKEWAVAVDEVLEKLSICRQALQKGALAVDSQALNQIGCYDRRLSGAGTVAAIAAIYLASRYAADPKTGLLEAAFAVGTDTDTIASMLGGILGALLGTEWIITEWQQVQDYNYLKAMANAMVNLSLDTSATQSSGIEHWKRNQSTAVLDILERNTVKELNLGSLGRAEVLNTTNHKPLTKSARAKSWKMSLDSGQTIYINKLARLREPSQFESALPERDLHTQQDVISGVSSRVPPVNHLFISYANEDSELAEWLTLRLTAEGYRVWCDRIKLLGGESYPRDIDKAIKTQTFRMLALISRHSLTKENPLKERTLGYNIGRQRKVDFVIPLLVDKMRPDELGWMDSDLTYIPFYDSWAQGLSQLTKKLRSIPAPNPLPNGARLVSSWAAQQSSLTSNQERLWTNLFEIKSLPDFVYRILTPDNFKITDPSWIFHKQSEHIIWSFEVPEPKLEYLAVKWNDNRRIPYGVPPIDMATILIKEHMRRLCLQKKAQETLDGEIYLSKLTAPDGWLRFIDYKGKQSRVLATSQRTVRASGGTRNPYRYHLSPVFRPLLRKYGIPVLELQVRLYLTDTQGKPLQPRITNRRRKRIARSWWNYQWISRILAIAQWAFDGQPIYNLAAGRNYDINVSGSPLSVMAPLGIDERLLKLPETVEEELDVVEDEPDDEEWDEEQP
jgi:ADP-ribosylglycohydrolase